MKQDLTVGQKVVHPRYGAGIVIEKQVDYYVIHIPCSALKLQLPVSAAQVLDLRRISSKGTMNQALGILSAEPAELPRDYRERRASLEAVLSKGEIRPLAHLVRDLFALQARKSLSSAEANLLSSAKRRLAGELALASDIDLAVALQHVEAALRGNPQASPALA
jgi:RNA polymerase-interacting CarD/CdnL/TRCF family regulator